ncbi:MAG: DUF1732 domain-containing protein [Candidatus Cloacimonetes bacterium]|nr:DUF1732 domain-containing protein [Candidatus Cloacimonadota bacterium]
MKSMTGFGKSSYIDDNFEIQIEIKSVNNKSFDLKILNYKELYFLDNEIKEIVYNRIKRGKVELRIIFRDKQIPEIEIDENRLMAYFEMILKIKDMLNIQEEIKLDTILQEPEVVIIKKTDYDTDEFREILFNCIEEALEKHQLMAQKEGMAMKSFFEESFYTIETCLSQIQDSIPLHRENLRENLENTIKQLLNADFTPEIEKRILVETGLYLDRCDITEEIIRTESHLENIKGYLKRESSGHSPLRRDEINIYAHSINEIGRPMNFILQEMQREINTISAKYTTTNTFMDVLRMKEEIEKCREQIQNVE